MKYIPTKDLIEMLPFIDRDALSKEHVQNLFENYGDDYFIEDGVFKLCNVNERRRQLILKIYEFKKGSKKEVDG